MDNSVGLIKAKTQGNDGTSNVESGNDVGTHDESTDLEGISEKGSGQMVLSDKNLASTYASKENSTTQTLDEEQEETNTSLESSATSHEDDSADPAALLLEDVRGAGRSSSYLFGTLKDSLFRKFVNSAESSMETRRIGPAIQAEDVKDHTPVQQSQGISTNCPIATVSKDEENIVDAKRTDKAVTESQNTSVHPHSPGSAQPSKSVEAHCSARNEKKTKGKKGIKKSQSLRKFNSSIFGRAGGNRARFTKIPNDAFNWVEVQPLKPAHATQEDDGINVPILPHLSERHSEIGAEDPFAAEGPIYISHTRCELALAHAARILEARFE